MHTTTTTDGTLSHPIPKDVQRYQLPAINRDSYTVVRSSNRGKPSIDPYEIVRFLEDNWIFYYHALPYKFNGCIYQQMDESYVEQLVYDLVFEKVSVFPAGAEKPLLTTDLLKNTMKLYINTHTPRSIPLPPNGSEAMAEYDSELGLIAFQNGILNLDSLEFLPFTPYIFLTFQIQAMYDPTLTEHKVEKIYKKILPDEATRNIFYRLVGYTVFSDTLRMPGIFMLYGGGETGKTSLQKAIAALIGPDSYTSLSMVDFADKFAPSMLEGKRANFCGEADSRSATETKISGGMLKDISESGKTITVRRIYSPPMQIEPTAKLWFCSNVMPDFGDRTSGLYRRLYIIPCRVKQRWDDQIQDVMLEPTALTWLANKCFAAYMEFLADGCKITPSDDMKTEINQYMMQNTLMEFLEEEFGHVSSKDELAEKLVGQSVVTLYSRYEAFCRTRYAKPVRSSDFSETIRNEYNMQYSYAKEHRLPDGKTLQGNKIYVRRE